MVGWQASVFDSMVGTYGLRAGALNRGLPPRDSLIVAVDSLSWALSSMEPAGQAHLALVCRLFRTLDRAIDQYPTDPEVWYWLGDMRTHWGYYVDVPASEALEAFDRAIALDSGFAPAFLHQPLLVGERRDPDRLRHYVDAYLRLDPRDKHGMGFRLTRNLLEGTEASLEEASRMLDTARAEVVGDAALKVVNYPDSAETALRLAEVLAKGRVGSRPWSDSALMRDWFLIPQLLWRGHPREAAQVGTEYGPSYASLALLEGVPRDSAALVFGRWLAQRDVRAMWALWWWAEQRDTLRLKEFISVIDSIFDTPPRAPRIGRAAGPFMMRAAPAYLALARGGYGRCASRIHLPARLDLSGVRLRAARDRSSPAGPRQGSGSRSPSGVSH